MFFITDFNNIMRAKTDIGKHVQKPEYRQALQELIKYELQALVCGNSFADCFLLSNH